MDRKTVKKGRFTYLIDENDHTAWIGKGHIGHCRKYHVPDSVEIEGATYRITSLEAFCFNRAVRLRKLVIPDSITYVDEDLLLSFPNLRSLYIGKGLMPMRQFFLGYGNSVVIDKENPHMRVQDNLVLSKDGTEVLASLYNKHYYEVPMGVKKLSPLCFLGNTRTTYVDLPDSLEEIGAEAFSSADRLEYLFLPDGVKSIGNQAFWGCGTLREIKLPDSLRNLGFECLNGCVNLKEIELGNIHSKRIIDIKEEDLGGVPTDDCALIVPHQLMEAYSKHPVWGRFGKMVDMNELL